MLAAMDEVIKEDNLTVNQKAYDCLTTVMNDFDTTSFYTPKRFQNGYTVREVLDYNLSDQAKAFENWYTQFCDALAKEAE